MIGQATAQTAKFVRRTTLEEGEYRVNFRQIDCDVLGALTSSEARKVTPLMSHIYLCLINAPSQYWERDGVLRFTGDERRGKPINAWKQLRELLEVANSTVSKALNWMHDEGIIGYYAGRNGVGIRIFINRAAASIRTRRPEKNLRLVQAPSLAPRTPSDGTPFKEEACKKNLEVDKDPAALTRAPETVPAPEDTPAPPAPETATSKPTSAPATVQLIRIDEALSLMRAELSATVVAVCSREVERTREWLEKAGLPKAVRVAQHETYELLRSLGIIERATKTESKAKAKVGSSSPKFNLTRDETIRLWVDLARSVRGKPLDEMLTEYVTRNEMSSEQAREILREASAQGLWSAESP